MLEREQMVTLAQHLRSGQSRLTGQSLDGKSAGKMASANVAAREILEDAAALVSDSLQLSHDDHL